MFFRSTFCIAIAAAAWLPGEAVAGPVDLLPDMIVNSNTMKDNEIRYNSVPGEVVLALSNSTANIGDGTLEILGVQPPKDHSEEQELQEVVQRIYRDDDSFYDVTAGFFVYHPEHNHVHFADWAIYYLREILPGNGVGDIVATGDKTSFCLLDSRVYDNSLPNFPGSQQYKFCTQETPQGISVGYEDVYEKSLPDQWIIITDLPEGEYWLESVVDPDDNVIEKDENNNVTRIKVTIEFDENPGPNNPQGFFAFIIAFIQQLLQLFQSLFQT